MAVAWTGAWAEAVAVAGVGAVAWVYAVAVVGAVAVAGAVAGAWAWAWAGTMTVTGAWAWAWAWALAWLVQEPSIFDRWKNTDWFDSVTFIIFLVLPGIVTGITVSFLSKNILLGIGTGVASTSIFFAQAFAAYELYRKKFTPFNIVLIIAGTNSSGLGSGWLLSFLLHPKG